MATFKVIREDGSEVSIEGSRATFAGEVLVIEDFDNPAKAKAGYNNFIEFTREDD